MITRYLITRLSVLTSAMIGVLVCFVWMGQSLRFIELLSVYRISLGQFFALMGYMVPDLVGVVLPFAFTLSVIWVIHQMIRDREWVVLRSAGFSDFQISRGFLIAAGVWGLLVWGIQGYAAPYGLSQFKALEAQFKSMSPKKLLRSGEFVTHEKLTVYVGRRDGLKCETIFLHDTRSSKPVTIFARHGELDPSDHTLKLVLEGGVRQEWDPVEHRMTHLSFQQYALEFHLPSATSVRKPKPFELSMTQLLRSSAGGQEGAYTQKMHIEKHQRILSAFYLWAMALGVLVCALMQGYTRQSTSPLGYGLLVSLVLQACYHGLIQLSLRWSVALWGAYGVAFLSVALASFVLSSWFQSYRGRMLTRKGANL